MPTSTDFYKGIFLHVIPVRIIVPWFYLPHKNNWKYSKTFQPDFIPTFNLQLKMKNKPVYPFFIFKLFIKKSNLL